MKTTNLFQIIFSAIIVIFLTSCTQETAFEQTEETSSFKILPFTQQKNAIYTDNYKVAELTSNIDIPNNNIELEIPIPEGDFQLLNTYNISSDNNAAILYVIGRNSTQKVVDNPINFVIQDNLNISDLGLDTNLLQNGNGLRIFVMNTVNDIDTNSDLFNCILDKVENNDLVSICTVNKSGGGPDIFGDFIILR